MAKISLVLSSNRDKATYQDSTLPVYHSIALNKPATWYVSCGLLQSLVRTQNGGPVASTINYGPVWDCSALVFPAPLQLRLAKHLQLRSLQLQQKKGVVRDQLQVFSGAPQEVLQVFFFCSGAIFFRMEQSQTGSMLVLPTCSEARSRGHACDECTPGYQMNLQRRRARFSLSASLLHGATVPVLQDAPITVTN